MLLVIAFKSGAKPKSTLFACITLTKNDNCYCSVDVSIPGLKHKLQGANHLSMVQETYELLLEKVKAQHNSMQILHTEFPAGLADGEILLTLCWPPSPKSVHVQFCVLSTEFQVVVQKCHEILF